MKKLKLNIMAIIGMMVAVGTVAFTAPTKMVTQWYEIEANGSTTTQDFLGSEISDPSQGGQCGSLQQAVRCAVEIENPNNTDLSEMTVEEALVLDPDITIKTHTYRPQ